MKKILKIVLGTVGVIFLLLLVLPFVFKGKIEKLVKTEINKQVNATVDYSSFSLSLIRSFPNLSVSMDGLNVVGKGAFEGDTLLNVNGFSTEVDVMSAISGQVEIKSVLIDRPAVHAKVLADSTANWDIMIAGEEQVEDTTTSEASDFTIQLESFEIRNANITYLDETMNLDAGINDFNLALSGDMSQKSTNLTIESGIEAINVVFDGVKYLNGAKMGLTAGINADLENMIFTFLENELSLNGLALGVDGSVHMKEDAIGLDLKIGAKKTDFKTLLALVPEVYLKDFEELKTTGKLALESTVKGDFTDSEHLPAFDLVLLVENASVQYPDLPKSIDQINVDLKVNNPGGSPDATVASIDKFHFELGGNPFDARMKVIRPVSNPAFSGKAKGKIDLGSLADALPLDSFELKGLVSADLVVDGDYEMIEKEAYEQIKANGQVGLKGFLYTSPDMPQSLEIKQAEMTFSPRYLDLASFSAKMGRTDFNLKGRLENYLAYALKDGVLKGKLVHTSKLVDSNEFLSESTEEEVETTDITALEVIEVPKTLDFVLSSKIDRLLYDKLVINNTAGKIVIKNGRVVLDGLSMNLLDGSMKMSGQYNTQNMKKPFVDLNINASKIDINMAANSFSVVDSLVPIAKKAAGKVSSRFSYYSELGDDFMPVLSTVGGEGNVKSKGVEVSGAKIQDGLAAALKDDKYKVMKAEDLDINFKLKEGNLIVEPFTAKIFDKKVTVAGTQGLDQTMNYNITMPVSRKELAGVAGLMGMSIPTSGDDLPVDILIKGTVSKPEIKLNLEKATKVVGKELEKEAEKAVKNLLKDDDLKKKFESIFK
ncbi:AsmA family protein [Marinilabiliaceae bacterium JC017]|nr:AsmA family protein [Marinilabiliaceae bacterium JC017]